MKEQKFSRLAIEIVSEYINIILSALMNIQIWVLKLIYRNQNIGVEGNITYNLGLH